MNARPTQRSRGRAAPFAIGRPADQSPEGVKARAWRNAAVASAEALAYSKVAMTWSGSGQIMAQRNVETRWICAVVSLLTALS